MKFTGKKYINSFIDRTTQATPNHLLNKCSLDTYYVLDMVLNTEKTGLCSGSNSWSGGGRHIIPYIASNLLSILTTMENMKHLP